MPTAMATAGSWRRTAVRQFLVATSCRSCHTPYCMDGCPVDAIHRGAQSLEVTHRFALHRLRALCDRLPLCVDPDDPTRLGGRANCPAWPPSLITQSIAICARAWCPPAPSHSACRLARTKLRSAGPAKNSTKQLLDGKSDFCELPPHDCWQIRIQFRGDSLVIEDAPNDFAQHVQRLVHVDIEPLLALAKVDQPMNDSFQ